MNQRHTIIPVSYIVLKRDNLLLVSRRFNTGYGDGMLSFPAGHAEDGETFSQAAIRECREEVGVIIAPADLKPLHVMQHLSVNRGKQFAILFFVVEQWQGEPTNCEPSKCSEVFWADAHALPADMLPHVKAAVEKGLQGIFYSEWSD